MPHHILQADHFNEGRSGASSDQQILKKVLEACKIEETKGINRGIVPIIEWILSILIALFFVAAFFLFLMILIF